MTQNLSALCVIRDLRGGLFTLMAHILRLYEVTLYAIRKLYEVKHERPYIHHPTPNYSAAQASSANIPTTLAAPHPSYFDTFPKAYFRHQSSSPMA